MKNVLRRIAVIAVMIIAVFAMAAETEAKNAIVDNITEIAGNAYRYAIPESEYYIADSSVTTADRMRADAYFEKYLSQVPEIWEQFRNDGWKYYITTKPINSFLEDESIGSGKGVSERTVGLTVTQDKVIVSSVEEKRIEIAVIHEFGHYVFREWISTKERLEFRDIYNRYMESGSNELEQYRYTDHCVENASEFFAESFQRYMVGLAENDGDASKIDNLTDEVRDFIAIRI